MCLVGSFDFTTSTQEEKRSSEARKGVAELFPHGRESNISSDEDKDLLGTSGVSGKRIANFSEKQSGMLVGMG